MDVDGGVLALWGVARGVGEGGRTPNSSLIRKRPAPKAGPRVIKTPIMFGAKNRSPSSGNENNYVKLGVMPPCVSNTIRVKT